MNIIVHLLIARSVRKIVYEQTGEKLSYTGFLYGNILPDISRKHGAAPHNYKSAMEHIMANTERLKKEIDEDLINTFSRSKRTGVITHYLSDFFCYPHCERYNGGRYQHHVYELSMLFSFRRGFLFCQKHKQQTVKFSELASFIVGKRTVYAEEEQMRIRDIAYAITISAAAASCLATGKACLDRNGLIPAYDI